jgi:hypothetical protein
VGMTSNSLSGPCCALYSVYFPHVSLLIYCIMVSSCASFNPALSGQEAVALVPRALSELQIDDTVAHCRTGAQLAAAINSADVRVALLVDDLKLTNADFTVRVVLTRNFTIKGGLASRPVVLNFNFLREKVVPVAGRHQFARLCDKCSCVLQLSVIRCCVGACRSS